jgi:hypothetical protein
MRRYCELWKTDARGLAVRRSGEWYWTDWGEHVDEQLLESCLLALAHKGLWCAARALDLAQDAERHLERYRRLGSSLAACWKGDHFRSPGYEGEVDDRSQALLILAVDGLEARFSSLAEVFRQYRHASTYTERFVLEALFRLGRPDLALERMKSRYDDMVTHPLSTLWEQWQLTVAGSGPTPNHAWSGGPLYLMSRFLAGIEPLSPGFQAVRISPVLSGLDHFTCGMQSPVGPMRVRCSREEWQYIQEVFVPEGVPTTIAVPKTAFTTRIKINGRIIRDTRDAPVRVVPGIQVVGETGDHITFQCNGGAWLFEVF